jgi:hypothetical protein
VAHWLHYNSIDTLLIGLTDGELAWDETVGDFAARGNMPLPPVISDRFPVEPKWVRPHLEQPRATRPTFLLCAVGDKERNFTTQQIVKTPNPVPD